MLWHYTTRLAASAIREEGIIRAKPVIVYTELLAPLQGGKPIELGPPVIWLTINPYFDLSVVTRESLNGLRLDLSGDFWRFGVSDEVAPLGLAEWSEKHRHPLDLFRWMVVTGKLAGSDYTTWRLCERDLVVLDWLSIEQWTRASWESV